MTNDTLKLASVAQAILERWERELAEKGSNAVFPGASLYDELQTALLPFQETATRNVYG